ncbi:cytochrome b [Novosphingobium panipatense]|uniref:Cytochrome b561 n=1 Tax=Novosphingobium panipatense TaxID=428991 RepID=A0ABY1QJT3_9SPHN|nr:cytochrome b [Novosphingobium panipatense]SMP69930.1 cytochrome b561 [Novosphingobium panipatense]
MDYAKYNAGARALHWITAVIIVANLAGGLLKESLSDVVPIMPVHKATGVTVLALSLIRLGWRLTWRAPAYPATMGRLERGLAHSVHGLLYLLMIAMPLSGWIMSSGGKYPISWFGLFEWPKLPVPRGSVLQEFGAQFHETAGWLMLALVLGHVAAALRHHFILKDGVLRRML